MMRKISLPMLIFMSFLLAGDRLVAQDSAKVVILSPRVGPTIDVTERKYFRLFQQIKDFDNATIYQTQGGDYFAHIVLKTPNGATSDTTIQYSLPFLLGRAEYIDHFEEIKSGKYQWQYYTKLQVVGGQDISWAEIMAKMPGARQEFVKVSDLLPFANNEAYIKQESFPQFGFGVDLSTYSSDFGELTPAFTAIENKYRQQGYTIDHYHHDFDLSPLLWYNLQIRFSIHLDLLLEAGTNLRNNDNSSFKAVSAVMLYCFKPVKKTLIRPYIGADLGSYHFKMEQKYGNPISRVYPDGSYSYLDVISATGGSTGVSTMAGIEFTIHRGLGLSFYGNYLLIPSVTTSSAAGDKITVKMSSLVAGVRIYLYL